MHDYKYVLYCFKKHHSISLSVHKQFPKSNAKCKLNFAWNSKARLQKIYYSHDQLCCVAMENIGNSQRLKSLAFSFFSFFFYSWTQLLFRWNTCKIVIFTFDLAFCCSHDYRKVFLKSVCIILNSCISYYLRSDKLFFKWVFLHWILGDVISKSDIAQSYFRINLACLELNQYHWPIVWSCEKFIQESLKTWQDSVEYIVHNSKQFARTVKSYVEFINKVFSTLN